MEGDVHLVQLEARKEEGGDLLCLSVCTGLPTFVCVYLFFFLSLGKEAGGYLTLTSVYIFKSRGSSFFLFFSLEGSKTLKKHSPLFRFVHNLSLYPFGGLLHTISGAFEASLISPPPRIENKDRMYSRPAYVCVIESVLNFTRRHIMFAREPIQFLLMDVGEHPFLKTTKKTGITKEASHI